ncbi:MAG: hypothetical protein QW790_01030 [Candidatus Aenigmatarchaeota archaeon]
MQNFLRAKELTILKFINKQLKISKSSYSFLKESAEEGRYNKASVGEPCSTRRLGHYLLLGSNIFKSFYKPCHKHRARVNTQRSKVEK